ncbi:MAG: ribonuclease III [Angelakisella sp.]|jgi:ribonuclease-3 family protein|nr:ribonuclease III [Angelakisella sp.]
MTALDPKVERPELLSPLALAFVGDGVYELLARQQLLARGSAPVGRLHSRTVELVSAAAQARAYRLVAPLLSPEEEAIYRRGRNANSTRSPRHTDPAVYRCATGMEALFGWLYLTGQVARLEQLFQVILAGQEGTP